VGSAVLATTIGKKLAWAAARDTVGEGTSPRPRGQAGNHRSKRDTKLRTVRVRRSKGSADLEQKTAGDRCTR